MQQAMTSSWTMLSMAGVFLYISATGLAAPSPQERVYDYVSKVGNRTFQEPSGTLRFKYLTPGGPYFQMWDWDSFFEGVALLEFGSAPYLAGAMANFLDHTNVTDGQVQGCLIPSGATGTIFHAKPVIIQGAWIASQHDTNTSANADTINFKQFERQMKAILTYWISESRTDSSTGLPKWYNQLESGQDNLVLSTCASDRSPECWDPNLHELVLVSADLATFLYREFEAYALFQAKWKGEALKSGDSRAANWHYLEHTWALENAQKLKTAVNKHLWDDDLGYYIALNTSRAAIKAGKTRVLARTDVMGFPLWAKMPTSEQAAKLRENLLKDDMMSPFGVRSTSSADPRYNNKDEIKPYSNWQGPVWVNANCVLSIGLFHYGYKDDANHISNKVVSTLANDLIADSTWHEGYDAETGKGLAAKGFLSWDTLVATWPLHLANGIDPFALSDHGREVMY